MERDANAIAQRTRRGKGNMILCSADVASALTMAGVLDYTPALNAGLNVDDTGNTFAGVLQGKYRVYIDPYSANVSANQYYVVGYKGSSLTTQVYSTALMFPSKWFAPLVRTPSNPRLDSRLATASSRTPSLRVLPRAWEPSSPATPTATIVASRLPTSCDSCPTGRSLQGDPSGSLFLFT